MVLLGFSGTTGTRNGGLVSEVMYLYSALAKDYLLTTSWTREWCLGLLGSAGQYFDAIELTNRCKHDVMGFQASL
jgi:hypothetical protein